MSFGDGDLHVQVAQLKTENARLKQQVDKLRTEVNEKDGRIGELEAYGRTQSEVIDAKSEFCKRHEALVRSLFNTMNTLRINGHAPTGRQLDHYEQRMAALGIEVDE